MTLFPVRALEAVYVFVDSRERLLFMSRVLVVCCSRISSIREQYHCVPGIYGTKIFLS